MNWSMVPTDNLYKFIALSGFVAAGFLMYLTDMAIERTATTLQSQRENITKFNAMVERLQIEFDIPQSVKFVDMTPYVTFEMDAFPVDDLEEADPNEEFELFLKGLDEDRKREFFLSLVDVEEAGYILGANNTGWEMSKYQTSRDFDRFENYFLLALALGIAGLLLWYFKVQRFEDGRIQTIAKSDIAGNS